MKSVIAKFILFFFFFQTTVYGMSSSNYSISSLNSNYGSGSRASDNYQISTDAIVEYDTGSSSSSNYSILGVGTATIDDLEFTSSVYINADADSTNSESVILDLVCSSKSGCGEVMVSNNGVSWSDPISYTTSVNWELVSNDGLRSVFVKYKNGTDEWSGICSDTIVLDTTAPGTSISPVSGTFMENPQITLTASEPGIIYYTTDGTDPTIESEVYSDPIPLTIDTTIKCFSVDLVGNVGPVASDEYTVCSGSSLSISGIVKDVTIDKGMPMAVITLNSGHETNTDIDGNYTFTSLPRGYYAISSITTPSEDYVTYQKELILCMVGIEHDVLLTKSETVFGGDTFSGYSADSVNTATGNYFYGANDLAIPGRGFSFSFDRSYNSQDKGNGPLGYGWTHNYNITLSEDGAGNVTARWGDGKTETWVPDGAGNYTPMLGIFDTLIKNPDNTFSILQKDLIQHNFNLENRLASVTDENENELAFEYVNNNLSAIIDTSGRRIEFQNDTEGRITRILDSIGRSITFSYDVKGDLVNFTNRNGNIITYTYDGSHQMRTITDSKGNKVVTNEYDEQRRVVSSQRDAMGAETLYSYDTLTKTSQMIDPEGNVTYHHFDDLLRLIKETDANNNSAYYVFTEKGNIASVTDKNGNVTSYSYDDNGNVLTKTDPLGNQTHATYDSKNNPLTKTDALGHTKIFVYTPDANLQSVTDALNNSKSYTYDSFGQVITSTDALGNVTSSEYDPYGNLISHTDVLGNQSTFVFDLVGRKLSESHPLGRASAYEYDDMDNLISVTDALGGTSSFIYDKNGNKIEHIDASKNKTAFSYDAKNRLISRTNALGITEYYTYDKLDRMVAVTNNRGNTSKVVYDSLGNVIQEIDAGSNRVQYEYDPNGNKIKSIDALGNTTVFSYDAKSRLVKVTDPLNKEITTTYDANGNVMTVTDPLGKTVTSTYDELGRLLTITDPLGNTVSSEYDSLGRLVKVTDARGNFSQFIFDDVGRLVSVTDTTGNQTSAVYNEVGNRTSMTDTLGNTTTYTYDLLNRLAGVTDALGNSEVMEYDAVGNLVSLSNADGTTTYNYDTLYRLTTINYPDATTVSYTYDENGNRTSVSDQMGMTSYAYNTLDQLQAVTSPFGQTIGYTYGPRGIRNAIKYPGNKTVSYIHDAVSRLVSVSDWTGVTTTYQYDDANRIIGKTMGNGSTVSFKYDNAGRLIEKTDKKSDGQTIASYIYTLDENGNRTAMDMMQPLLPSIEYLNDNFIYDEGHQIVESDTTTFTHDGKGNRTGQTKDAITTQYAYNPDNMLTRVEKDGNVDEYQYNSDGHRLASLQNGVETRYLLDVAGGMETILAEMNDENNIQQYNIYGKGLLYTIDADTGKKHFHHYDPLGSTIAIADKDENITDKFAYLPYGEPAGSVTENNSPFTFVGKYGVMQEDNGLYFMRARYYDSETKRFLSKDPIKGDFKSSQTLNPYIYTESNPILFNDPSGEIIPWGTIANVGLSVASRFILPHFVEGEELKNWQAGILVTQATITIYSACTGDIGSWGVMALDVLAPVGAEIAGIIYESSLENQPEQKSPTYNGAIMHASDTINVQSGYQSSEPIMRDITKELKENSTGSPGDNGDSSPAEETTLDSSDGEPTRNMRYLNVGSYASSHFRREFAKLKDPYFFDTQIQSYIESRVQSELFRLQQKRYGYNRNADNYKKQKRRAKDRMMGDISQSSKSLYASLTKALSKYSVLVRDMDKLPGFNSGNINRSGVYAK